MPKKGKKVGRYKIEELVSIY